MGSTRAPARQLIVRILLDFERFFIYFLVNQLLLKPLDFCLR